MTRILLVFATALAMVVGYTAPADACGVKLTVKAPRVKKKVKPSENPSRILLVGNPPRRLAALLSESGHTVDVADNPSEAKKGKRYAVVMADREQLEETEDEFPNSYVIPRSGSTRANLREVERTLAEGPSKPRRRRRAIARRSRQPRERQARESRPQPRRPAPGPGPEIARTATPDTDTESPSGVASINTSGGSETGQATMVTVPRNEEPRKRPEPEPEVKDPEPERIAAREYTFTEEFFFGPNSMRLNKRSRRQLAENARWLKQNPEVSIRIEGHTDAAGPAEYNMMLGERRAKAARDYLIRRGVPRSRIEIISYGEDRPAYSEDDDRNRRVVIERQ